MRIIGFENEKIESLVLDCRDILGGEEVNFEPNEHAYCKPTDVIFVLPINLFILEGQEVTTKNAVKNLKRGVDFKKMGFAKHLQDLEEIANTEKGFKHIHTQIDNIYLSYNTRPRFVDMVSREKKEINVPAQVFSSSLQSITVKEEETPFEIGGKHIPVVTVENAGMEPVKKEYFPQYFFDIDNDGPER